MVQEAFLTAIRRAEPVRDPVPWLCGVARNHARHAARADSRFRAMLGRLRLRRPAAPPPADTSAKTTLAEAVARVPPKLREAVVLKHVAGMTIEEVARAQGVSRAAARSRVRRGLAPIAAAGGAKQIAAAAAVLLALVVAAILVAPGRPNGAAEPSPDSSPPPTDAARLPSPATAEPTAGAPATAPGAPRRLATRADAEGRYSFEGVGAGGYDLCVLAQGCPAARVTGILVRPGEQVRQDVFVPEGHRVEGRVIDATTGEPVAGAGVGEHYPELGVRTGPDGRFATRVATSAGLLFEADGYLRTRIPLLRFLQEPGLDVALTPAWRASGRVLDAAGRPVGGALVRVDRKLRWAVGRKSVRSGEDGSYAIAGQWPSVSMRLLVTAPGRGVGGTPLLDLAPGDRETVDLVLGREPGRLRLLVRDAAGRPVPGARVAFRHADGGNGGAWQPAAMEAYEKRRRSSPGLTLVDYYRSLRETDARGRVDHPGLAPDRYTVEVADDAGRKGRAEVEVEDGGRAEVVVTVE